MNEVVRPQNIILLVWDLVTLIPRHISSIINNCSELKASRFDQKFHHQHEKPALIECLGLFYFTIMLSCKKMWGKKVETATFSNDNIFSQQSWLSARYRFLYCDLYMFLLATSRAALTCLLFLVLLVAQPKQSHSLGDLEINLSIIQIESRGCPVTCFKWPGPKARM